jgi:N-acetylglucosaminyldiphosphoundecaprenol N-acetyl-beta-D-mannosaminyltransferase
MPIRERVAGADLVPLLVEASQSTGFHVHVFGSAPAVADEARALLAARYPTARFSIDPGPMIPEVERIDDDVLASIADVDADILCVALGNPKQERFIRAHRDRLRTPVMIGVGGSLDMLVGKRKRAPGWVQRIGMEWVVRAAQEPRRLGRRYAHDIRVFGPRFATALRASRSRRDGLGLRLAVTDAAVEVRLGGAAVADHATWSAAARGIAAGAPLTIEADPGDRLRDPASAQLVGLVRLARWAGSRAAWLGSPSRIGAGLAAAGLSPAMVGLGDGWEDDHSE